MQCRCLAVASSVLIVLMAASAPAAAQSPAKKAPRTAWGHPDLQGLWTNDTFTPLQRPPALAGKAFFTPEEAEQLNKALTADGVDPLAPPAVLAALAAGKDSDALLQSPEDVHYDNSIWLTQNWRKGLSTLRTSMIFDPEDGRIPALTPDAQKREAARTAALKGHAFDDPESRPLGERCIIWPHEGPPLLPAPYNNIIEIFQTPAYVVIVQEIIHNARIIPLDGRPHISRTSSSSPEIRAGTGKATRLSSKRPTSPAGRAFRIPPMRSASSSGSPATATAGSTTASPSRIRTRGRGRGAPNCR